MKTIIRFWRNARANGLNSNNRIIFKIVLINLQNFQRSFVIIFFYFQSIAWRCMTWKVEQSIKNRRDTFELTTLWAYLFLRFVINDPQTRWHNDRNAWGNPLNKMRTRWCEDDKKKKKNRSIISQPWPWYPHIDHFPSNLL